MKRLIKYITVILAFVTILSISGCSERKDGFALSEVKPASDDKNLEYSALNINLPEGFIVSQVCANKNSIFIYGHSFKVDCKMNLNN